jgi:hypothetical protein
MSARSESLNGGMAFLILFPGYFVYHWLALGGVIPRVLGGFVNEASALVLLGLGTQFTIQLLGPHPKRPSWVGSDAAFLLFLCYFAAVVLLNAGLGNAPGVVRNHTASILQLAAVYFVFRTFPYRERTIWAIVMACFVGLSALVVEAASRDLIGLLRSGLNDDSAATHQGLARSYLGVAAIALMGIAGAPWRWLGYGLTLFVLFLIGARSEIAGAGVLFGTFEIARSRRPWRAAVLFVLTTAIAALLLWLNLEELDEAFPENRLIFLFLHGADDASVSDRQWMQERAWSAVVDSPVLGDFGHYEALEGAGAYAHNLLSVWVDLGVAGVLLMAAIVWSCVVDISALRPSPGQQLWTQRALCFGLLALALFLLAFAKNFTDPALGVAVGACAALRSRQRQAEAAPPAAAAGGNIAA